MEAEGDISQSTAIARGVRRGVADSSSSAKPLSRTTYSLGCHAVPQSQRASPLSAVTPAGLAVAVASLFGRAAVSASPITTCYKQSGWFVVA
ncbi:MAG: hypothetical protein OSB68_10225 [Dehalococcoidia bacterium]|nr:hypothetical protein [Dehalococcoidia bacterium]